MDSYTKKVQMSFSSQGGHDSNPSSKYDHDEFMKNCSSAILDYINGSVNSNNSTVSVMTYGGPDDEDEHVIEASEDVLKEVDVMLETVEKWVNEVKPVLEQVDPSAKAQQEEKNTDGIFGFMRKRS